MYQSICAVMCVREMVRKRKWNLDWSFFKQCPVNDEPQDRNHYVTLNLD